MCGQKDFQKKKKKTTAECSLRTYKQQNTVKLAFMDGGAGPWETNGADASVHDDVDAVCADEILPVEFLYRKHEAGLVIKQGS